MKNRIPSITPRLVGAGLLAATLFVTVGLKTLIAQTPPNQAHAAHVAAGTMPPDATKGDPALAQQVSELQAKVAQLEATLANSASPITAPPAGEAMPGMQAAAPATSMGMDKMKSGGAMANMSPPASPAPAMAGMSGMWRLRIGRSESG